MFTGGLNAYNNPTRNKEQQENWDKFWDNIKSERKDHLNICVECGHRELQSNKNDKYLCKECRKTSNFIY